MKVKQWSLCLGLIAIFVSLCAAPAKADLSWENENVSTNIPHQPNGTTIQKNYFTQNASRVELGNGKIMIIDYNAMKMYSLEPAAKTYTEIDINEMGMPPNMSPADKKKMGEMMGGMMGIQITPTNETKTIEGYKCLKYNVNIAMMNGEYWVSKDVKGYQELKALGARVGSVMEKNPMLRQTNIAGMVEKLDGFPVQTVNHIMGGTVVSTLKKVEQKSVDPALFRVPKDYTLTRSK